MDFEIKPLAYNALPPLSPQEEVALAAASWAKMGIPVEPRKNGLPTEDPRSPEQCKDPVATYCLLRDLSDLGLALETGPKTGLVAITAYTHDKNSGMHALQKAGLYCPCCDTAIRHETLMDGDCESVTHTVLYFSGKDTFSETALADLPGVFVRKSGEPVIIPPGMCDFGLGIGVWTKSTYEGQDTLAPVGITCLPDGLRKMIRAAERQALAEQRKPKLHGGVLPELYAPVAEGGRNNTLAQRAGYLLGVRKLTEEQTLKVLLDINQRCCQPPLGLCEVRNIARSIANKHHRHE
jgi:hypothetical protein